jgi:hypothetical protein
MGKRKILVCILFLLSVYVWGKRSQPDNDSILSYFKEIRRATEKNQHIWSKNLYGPILLVDPSTRKIYANYSDSSGILKKDGKIYYGVLPDEINIANTSINWNGRNWAMIMLPLPKNKQERLNLLAHELFHVNQPALGFRLFNPDNNHLDQKNGRIYLRLELEALKKAVLATTQSEQLIHLSNALTFRKYRHALYPGADSTENLLELNEGLSEYTGLILSGRNEWQFKTHFEEFLNTFFANPSYVRSFAYHTLPMYGYIFSLHKKDWNKVVSVHTNLTEYLIQELKVTLPFNLKSATDSLMKQYNGEIILQEENVREEKSKSRILEYKNKFIVQPHFTLIFEKMQVSFDPGNIIPMDSTGTYYPNMRISDNWGILTVRNGALMGKNWDKLIISIPLKHENNVYSGDGWILELKENYSVIKEEPTGNYLLMKK